MESSMQLKAKVKNIAKDKNVPAQSVLQNYILERFLERISLSIYREDFILKGGLLVSSILGIEQRSTMDIDVNLNNFYLDERSLIQYIDDITSVQIDDNVIFNLCSINRIRENEDVSFRVSLDTTFDKITSPIKIDISTGDIITPGEELYKIRKVFSNEYIEVLAYNIETVISEKFETVLRRGLKNTRMKDFYDIYKLTEVHWNSINVNTLIKAISKTCTKRKSELNLINSLEIINTISRSRTIKSLWKYYQKKYPYAKEVEFPLVMDSILNIAKLMMM